MAESKPATESGTVPFRWWIERNRFEPLDLKDLPGPEWPGWEANYDNDVERKKRTSRDTETMPSLCDHTLFVMRSASMVVEWQSKLGYNVEDDRMLHGGGLHVIEPGGWLSTHIDYARHPHWLNKERRLNLIAFLNPEWDQFWGGALQLCDPMGKPIKEIYPEPGMLVAFETGDESYHGVAPVLGPVSRVTCAC